MQTNAEIRRQLGFDLLPNAVTQQPVGQPQCVPNAAPKTVGELREYYRERAADWHIPTPPCPAGADFISWDEDCYQARKLVQAERMYSGWKRV
jgi:hypothetical protein